MNNVALFRISRRWLTHCAIALQTDTVLSSWSLERSLRCWVNNYSYSYISKKETCLNVLLNRSSDPCTICTATLPSPPHSPPRTRSCRPQVGRATSARWSCRSPTAWALGSVPWPGPRPCGCSACTAWAASLVAWEASEYESLPKTSLSLMIVIYISHRKLNPGPLACRLLH